MDFANSRPLFARFSLPFQLVEEGNMEVRQVPIAQHSLGTAEVRYTCHRQQRQEVIGGRRCL
jgi:hypothetical protein